MFSMGLLPGECVCIYQGAWSGMGAGIGSYLQTLEEVSGLLPDGVDGRLWAAQQLSSSMLLAP